ncbi:MAG: efflux transporter periplasmic adaptor subunit [Firmicutes bacterium HGW-Firmicutes-15]|nr:MAG: efflux transporter periplasmic adaptor subunit [Firmicutes bacterium HGW-Firmicutes-15]
MQEKETKSVGKRIRSAVKRIPRWLKWALAIVLVLAIAGGALILKSKNSPIPVEASKITKQTIERNVFASGRLKAMNEQTFFTPVDSTLMELKVKLGDQVKKGDVLGRLDSLELARLYQNAVAVLSGKESELARAQAVNDLLGLKMAEADYNKANNHYTRMEQLFQAGAVNVEEMESARLDLARADNSYHEAKIKASQNASGKQVFSLQSQVELAKQEVAQTKERLDLATFVAQFDGVVTSAEAKQGNRVMEGKEILVISDDSLLEVTADISEIDAGNLKIGQAVKASSIALPGKTYLGEIARIGGAAVVQKGTNGETINVPVTINLKEGKGELKIGYSVDLSIQTAEEKDVIALPINALIERDGSKVVYVIKNSVLEERKVEIKRGNELFDIAISGLNPDEEVVVNPKPELKNGQKVKIITGVPK